MFNNLSVSISSSVNLFSSILKLPALINRRASEFDFVMPNSVNIFGKCKVFSSGALYESITSGVFLLEIILSHYSNSPIIISKNDILEGLILKKY